VPKFNKFQIKALNDYLYYSDIHDARIKLSSYDRSHGILTVETINPIHNTMMTFIFKDVKIILSAISKESVYSKTIISLTVEDDYSCFQNWGHIYGNNFGNSLYLLFQMLSGDELHIICEEVLIDSVK